MAQAQLIQGTGAELLPYLQQLKHRKNLMLIIPEDDAPIDSRSAPPASEVVGLPPGTEFRNGVPLFPHRKVAEPVTLELVKRLDEDD
jgi:hypothetical protein